MALDRDPRAVALEVRWSRTTGVLLIVGGVAFALSAVTAGEPMLYALAVLSELAGFALALETR